ncbi:MAG TPA: hypothetical protein PKA66_07335 [Gemmatimonadales bacterium]|nr:hypothetical protein [Gemmatimonadales bacterium]
MAGKARGPWFAHQVQSLCCTIDDPEADLVGQEQIHGPQIVF